MEYSSLRPIAERSARPTSSRSPESHYWRKFRAPVFVKELAPITSIHFVPPVSVYSNTSLDDDATAAAPSSVIGSTSTQPTSVSARQKFAVTTGARVQIYSMRNSRVSKTISRFKDVARSANFRSDGRLMVAGDDSGLIQVFDTTSRAILRTLRGHSGPVHVTRFSPNGTEIMSASDDRTVRLWDVPEQKAVHVFEGHDDYVRSSVFSPDNPALMLSGSYDSTVKLWDARMGGCAMTMNHGAPVEDVLVYPTGAGGVALSVGGPVMKVWDLMMGGRVMASISNHQKTITSLALSVNSGADFSVNNEETIGGMRILTGGLDHLVKVYDPAQDFKVTHTMRYPSPILSMAVSPDESHIAVGMADGTLCVRKRDVKASELERREAERAAMNAGAYESFMQGKAASSNQPGKVNARRATDDIRVDSVRKRKLQDYDRFLKAFRYGDALDAALRKGVSPTVTFGLILELIHRSPRGSADGLRRAIAGRDDVTLEPVLRFLLRHAANPNYVDLVCDTLNVIVDTYASVIGQSPLIDDLFGRIWSKVGDELRLQRDLMQVRGSLEMILAGTALGAAATA
ncbi:related to UTP15 - nucleolar protein, component of the small subunit processome [Ustilago trichophora]|uniref:Related to UTP15 - nucleolar protein, component of the small subunit processome n=1 Tax=Ustilago trichophora TaxID=86804 RepID=A0A5C3EHK9_9BASI|nr:related to UTP15 - nucleolar protein, component of the small subunit processome [Ustilago trichophora]